MADMAGMDMGALIDGALQAAYTRGLSQGQGKLEFVEADGKMVMVTTTGNGNVIASDSIFHAPGYISRSAASVDVEGFSEYFLRHASEQSTLVQGSIEKSVITANFDGHEARGRGAHNLSLILKPTPEWKALQEAAGHSFSQERFADWLDDWAYIFEEPDAASLAEVVLALEGANNVAWSSKVDRVSGRVQMSYTEEGNAKSGTVQFPARGTVTLRVYEASDPVTLEVAFRYRGKGNDLVVGFIMPQVERTKNAAFRAVCQKVESATGHKVILAP